MIKLGKYRKNLLPFILGLIALLWIFSPISAITTDKCKSCCYNCQCQKMAKSLSIVNINTKDDSCGNMFTCLNESSNEFPYNVKTTNYLVEKQSKYEGIIPVDIIIHSYQLEFYIEYISYPIKTSDYLPYFQYRSPPTV